VFAQEVLLDQAGALTQKCVELALAGNHHALKLALERIVPVARDQPLRLALPTVSTPEDAIRATAVVTRAMANGTLTPSEAATMASVLQAQLRAFEVGQLADALEELERAVGEKRRWD
jgi:hypothetical protein